MINHFIIVVFGVFLLGGGNPQIFSPSDYFRMDGPSLLQQNHQQSSLNDSSSIVTICDDIQHGLASGDIQLLSKHFNRQVYLNLRGVDGGYFSINQAFYILQNYFRNHKVKNDSFSTISDIEESPFATGGGTFFQHGNTDIFQVYVALTKINGQWVVSQFNVY